MHKQCKICKSLSQTSKNPWRLVRNHLSPQHCRTSKIYFQSSQSLVRTSIGLSLMSLLKEMTLISLDSFSKTWWPPSIPSPNMLLMSVSNKVRIHPLKRYGPSRSLFSTSQLERLSKRTYRRPHLRCSASTSTSLIPLWKLSLQSTLTTNSNRLGTCSLNKTFFKTKKFCNYLLWCSRSWINSLLIPSNQLSLSEKWRQGIQNLSQWQNSRQTQGLSLTCLNWGETRTMMLTSLASPLSSNQAARGTTWKLWSLSWSKCSTSWANEHSKDLLLPSPERLIM